MATALLALGCADSGGSGTTPGGGGSASTSSPTWHADVAPLVAGHCQGCHTPGGIAPFPLETYAQAKLWAPAIPDIIRLGEMPPFLAADTAECQPRFGFKDDLRITTAELDLLQRWSDNGAPEGDASTAAPLPAPPELELKDAEVSIAIPAPITIDGDGDRFVCFSLAPDLSAIAPTGAAATLLGQNVLVDAVQIKPGNAAIVHHVLLFTDPTGESAALAGEQGYYDCFGGPKLDSPSLVMAWAPGSTPLRAPEGVAMVVPSSGRLVMQVHYHPHHDGPQTDSATSVQLRGYGDGIPAYVGSLTLLGNRRTTSSNGLGLQASPDEGGTAEFRIPAGATNHVETMLIGVPDSGVVNRIWAVGTHMHYAGKDMRIGLTRQTPGSEPAEECLLQTPNWDFDWQRGYLYDVPIEQAPTARGGDVVNLRCTYDNSPSNQAVQAALLQQGLSEPHDILLGEETLDEMCLGIFGAAQKVTDLLQ